MKEKSPFGQPVSEININNIRIGMFGYGCVGQGFVEVLQRTPGIDASLKKICVRNIAKYYNHPTWCFTTDKNEILEDENINVVIELTDDADAAYQIVKEALYGGKAVISANKKMIAEHIKELIEIQHLTKTPFLYEASCCASIPVIRNLEEYYDNDMLQSFQGIINGTTNYILTKCREENLTLQDALQQAQVLGYAESNPYFDIEGKDAVYKLVILLAHGFGILTTPDDILHCGISHIGEPEIHYAREKGYKLKLVAQALRFEDGQIAAFVLPQFVTKDEYLYQVDDVMNGVQTETTFADKQFFMGRGAGALSTGSAVLADLSALRYQYKYEYKKLHQGKAALTDAVSLEVYVRFPKEKSALLSSFHHITSFYQNNDYCIATGFVDLATLRKAKWKKERNSLVKLQKINAVTAFEKKPETTFLVQELMK